LAHRNFFSLSCVSDGGVAQMVERLLCMQEAQGSIPCSSKVTMSQLTSSHLLLSVHSELAQRFSALGS
jgi:hypothetical protein